ncbi:threonine synthase [Anaeromicrobium sediminis]|uniref:threonine synthase n=1 Tax=Anaeromicrobium sediminis TaxID=1478221 RepID=UPI00268BAB93|nr:threonine synthase [Anaeromicrobium sediminis]
MKYISTRDGSVEVSSSYGIIKGISEEGGLFVPKALPNNIEVESFIGKTYKEIATQVLSEFLHDFSKEDLEECVDKAYDNKFHVDDLVNLKKANNSFFLELFHGPTIAFKDMALCMLPQLMNVARKNIGFNKDVVILTATSGDTGKAALEGFANVDNTKIIVFYPKNGVSKIQESQMITQEGHNTYVVGIEGNFDDAQSNVKEMFTSKEMKDHLNNFGYEFSSANSINIGRLIPQVVYYVYSYVKLLEKKEIKTGEKINVVVPTGNFGNILAAYYAKNMGVKIDKLICASNENNVLSDFFKEGIYDKRREFKQTISPSMDILISSNLERLLYEIVGRDSNKVREYMNDLKERGVYKLSENEKNKLKDFYGAWVSEEETLDTVKTVYEKFNYVIDTHTAVAYRAYEKYLKDTCDDKKTIIASTASPFKFTKSVMEGLGELIEGKDDFQLLKELSEKYHMDIPKAVKELDKREILHDRVCHKDYMKDMVKEILA